MNVVRDTRREHDRLLVAGAAYLVAVVVLISLSSAVYQKVFTPVTWVTVDADRAGLQLPKFGDVRMHGVVIGQVRSISQDGEKAVIRLGLQPDAAKRIPSNVSVEIKPTTLFGQKYVEFVDPPRSAGTGLASGTIIPASRVRTTVELERILGKLSTILTAVRPQDLNATLHALATALEGNGQRLGSTISQLDDYLRAMNVHLPTLEEDITRFADVAHTYSLAAPDLVRTLSNATTTARTVAEQQDRLRGLFTSVAGLSGSTTRLLSENETGIGVEGRLAVPLLKLLATYSPEYPCLLGGLDKTTDGLNQVFRNSRRADPRDAAGGRQERSHRHPRRRLRTPQHAADLHHPRVHPGLQAAEGLAARHHDRQPAGLSGPVHRRARHAVVRRLRPDHPAWRRHGTDRRRQRADLPSRPERR